MAIDTRERTNNIAAVDLPPKVERIDVGDVGYHKHIVTEMEKLPQLRQQAQQVAQMIERITGAQMSWMAYAQEKYRLVEGDSVQQDGVIVRARQGDA